MACLSTGLICFLITLIESIVILTRSFLLQSVHKNVLCLYSTSSNIDTPTSLNNSVGGDAALDAAPCGSVSFHSLF